MKSLSNIFVPVFTPFYDASKKTYIGIVIAWILIFAVMWRGAPALWPTPTEILTQLKVFITQREFYDDVLASLFLTIMS